MLKRMQDRYGKNVLSSNPHREGSFAVRPRSQRRPVRIGEVVEDVATGFVGAVIRVESPVDATLWFWRTAGGWRRGFPLGPGYWVDGVPVDLLAPTDGGIAAGHLAKARPAPARSAGGRKLTAVRFLCSSGSASQGG